MTSKIVVFTVTTEKVQRKPDSSGQLRLYLLLFCLHVAVIGIRAVSAGLSPVVLQLGIRNSDDFFLL